LAAQATDRLEIGGGVVMGTTGRDEGEGDERPPEALQAGRVFASYLTQSFEHVRVTGGAGAGWTDTGMRYATVDVGALASLPVTEHLTLSAGPLLAASMPTERGPDIAGEHQETAASAPAASFYGGGDVGLHYALSEHLALATTGMFLLGADLGDNGRGDPVALVTVSAALQMTF